MLAALLLGGGLAVQAAQPHDALSYDDRRLFADGLFSRNLHARAATEYGALVRDFPEMEQLDVVLFRWAEALRLADQPHEAGRVLLQLLRTLPESPYRHRALFQRGAIALTADQFEAAVELLGALLAEDPPDELREPALYYRAEAFAQGGLSEEAIRYFEQMLQDYPDSSLGDYARLSLGRLLSLRNTGDDQARARELFRTAAGNPASPRIGAEALYLLAQTEFALGRYRPSAEAYLELLRTHPTDDRARAAGIQAAWASYQAGLFAECIELARQITASDTDDHEQGLYLLGSSAFRLTRYREAAEALERLVREHPQTPYLGAAWYQIATARHRLGEHALAATAARQVPATDPLRRDTLWLLAETYVALKDADRAIQFYRLLADEFPDSEQAPEALYRLAHQLQEREAWTDASAAYLRLVDRFPDHALTPRALFASGFVQLNAGHSARAIRDWDTLLQRFPRHETAHEARFRKALEEIRLERFDDAVATLNTLLREDADGPHRREALFWRANMHHRRGDGPAAEEDLRAVLADAPTPQLERESRYLMGLIAQQAGLLDRAAEQFQTLLDDPLATRFTPHQLAWLAEHQQAAGAFEAAAAAARRLAADAPDDAWRQVAWTLVGRATLRVGDSPAAETAFQKATDVPGDTRYAAEAHLRLGELRLKADDAAAAERHFRSASRQASTPDLQSIRLQAHIGLGRTLRATGDREEAARYLLGICLLYQDETLLPELIEETIPLLRELDLQDEADTLLKDLFELYPNSAAAQRLTPPTP